MKTYKVDPRHRAEDPESIRVAVRDLMDEILVGIVRNLPDNPTIPEADSRACTPSPL